MRRWLHFVALKWTEGHFHTAVAVVIGNCFQSLILFLFGWSMSYYVALPMAKTIVPPFLLGTIPLIGGLVFASLPWVIPFLPALRWRDLETEKKDSGSN